MSPDTENFQYDEETIRLMKQANAPDEYSKEEQADEPEEYKPVQTTDNPEEAKPVPISSVKKRKRKGSK